MTSHPYLAQRRLFKAYDIRGDRALFTESFITRLSQIFAELYRCHQAKIVVIGHDVRHGSETMAAQLARTLRINNIDVVWLGLVTTPMMAFWANEFEGHGMIATASHSEGHILGIKWLLNGESPSRDDIQGLYAALHPSTQPITPEKAELIDPTPLLVDRSNQRPNPQSTGQIDTATLTYADISYPPLTTEQTAQGYFAAIASAFDHIHSKTSSRSLDILPAADMAKPMTIVIDCLNGATAPFAQQLFAQFDTLCANVTVLNDCPDGDFPNGNPDPTENGRLHELQQAVIAHHADIGFGFDGDGDRLMVVDNRGQVLAPDHLLYLLAHIALTDSESPSSTTPNSSPKTVIFDVKCSHHLPKLIEQMGARPEMGRTGSSIMRKALQNGSSNAIFAGELSGHFLFNDGYFILHDDAMYAALRLLNWLTHQPEALADITERLPEMVNTPDVYLPLDSQKDPSTQDRPLLKKLAKLCQNIQNYCPTGAHLESPDNPDTPCPAQSLPISHANTLGLPNNTRLTCIDGLRLDFTNGFGVIRPSNTSHSLTVRFAGNTLADLRAVQQRFVDLCQFIDSDLASQIAKIAPSR